MGLFRNYLFDFTCLSFSIKQVGYVGCFHCSFSNLDLMSFSWAWQLNSAIRAQGHYHNIVVGLSYWV